MEEEHGYGRASDLTRLRYSKERPSERRFKLLGRDPHQPFGIGMEITSVDSFTVFLSILSIQESNLSEHFILFHRLFGEPCVL